MSVWWTLVRKAPLPALALVLALVGAACGGAPAGSTSSSASAPPTPGSGGSLTVAWPAPPATLDPALATAPVELAVVRAVCQGLLRYAPAAGSAGTVLVPCLATEVPSQANGGISADGHSYTFRLRRGVTFHPPVNREVTAADVKYSLERMLRTAPAARRGPYEAIAGGRRFAAGQDYTLSGVTVVDDYTLRIQLGRPDPLFPAALAADSAVVVPREWVERWGAEFAQRPIGTGPFVLAGSRPDSSLQLTRNPLYWEAGRPHVDEVIFELGLTQQEATQALRRGVVDVLGFAATPARLAELTGSDAGNRTFATRSLLSADYLFLNTAASPFNSAAARQAVSMAIDRARLARISQGRAEQLRQFYPVDLPGYDPALAPIAHSAKRARALLRTAGYGDGLTVTFIVERGAWTRATIASLRADLAAVGVTTRLRLLGQREYRLRLARGPALPMGLVHWAPGLPDPGSWMDTLCGVSGAQPAVGNLACWHSAALQRQRTAADALPEAAARFSAYTAMQRTLAAAAPYVPLTSAMQTSACSSFVGGFYLHPVYQFDFAGYWKQ